MYVQRKFLPGSSLETSPHHFTKKSNENFSPHTFNPEREVKNYGSKNPSGIVYVDPNVPFSLKISNKIFHPSPNFQPLKRGEKML